MIVFAKESDKYQWLVLEQKSQCEVEVRQTDNHGTITARDNYELTRNVPKCVGLERLCDDAYMHANFQIPFNADEINVIYQFGEQSKAETCAELNAATLYTRDKAVMRKLDTLVADFPDIYKLTGQDEVSKTYSFPKSFIGYRKQRAVSTEQRERARQMMIKRNKV